MPRKSTASKIKVFKKIKNRIPVNFHINDPNRKLMIKFKYGTITNEEFVKFHEGIKNLIYKAMHTNMVMMDWDDIYQEIWQKIIKSKHTWKENKGTFVSTWITIVANSVINTLRQGVVKHNSRFCLYDDLCCNTGDGESTSEMSDIVLFHKSDESFLEKIGGKINATMWDVDFQEFVKSLEPDEKTVLAAAFELQDEFLDAYERGVRKPFGELREKTGYDETTVFTILNNLKLKYESLFDTTIKSGVDASKIEDSDSNEMLF